MTRLPSFTIEIFSTAPDGSEAAVKAAIAAQIEFDRRSKPGYGSYMELTDNQTGEELIGNGTEDA